MTKPLMLRWAFVHALACIFALAPNVPATADVTVAASGDISPEPAVSTTNDLRTAELVGTVNPAVVLAIGDTQYEDGQYTKYVSPTGYAQSWGAFRSQTCAVPGNHEYFDPAGHAQGFFKYFAGACPIGVTGRYDLGYYAYNLGTWRVYALNANCHYWGDTTSPPCGRYDAMVSWLRADLQSHPGRCKLAYWHQPRWATRAPWPDDSRTHWLWSVFAYWGGDLVLSGHSHAYERFTSMTSTGVPDPTFKGPREIIVGTGGRSLIAFSGTVHAGSRYRDATHYGVLRLTLGSTGWSSAFFRTDRVLADRVGAGCS